MDKIIISQESYDNFQREKGLLKNSTFAPIDEKNVTSDWIDSIFDDYNVTTAIYRHGEKLVGFVGGEVVCCQYSHNNNTINWKIFAEGEKVETTKSELKKRLQQFENGEETDLFSIIRETENQLMQSFYFKGDE